jgi:hypothetical protein
VGDLESTKLPGLMRTFSTHLTASIAARGWKWMSAEMGTSQPAARTLATMSFKASASFWVAAVMRTSSQPARASSRVWNTVASTSLVLVVVMDCTRMGASPPM